jgi:peptidoglycan/LPS O-acetylase OafA/YrhL
MILFVLEAAKYVAAGLVSSSEPFAYQRSMPAFYVNVLFLQGAGLLDELTWNKPSWSISCEMIAYAAFALVALTGFFRMRQTWVLLLPITAAYLYLARSYGTLDITFDLGAIRCLCGFFLGAIISRLAAAPFPGVLAGAAMLATVTAIATQSGSNEFLVIPAFGLLIFSLRDDRSSIARAIRFWPLAFLGKISYSIYMVHYIVVGLMSSVLRTVFHLNANSSAGFDAPIF